MPDNQAAELLAEYQANPSGVIAALCAEYLGTQPPEKRRNLN